MYSHQYDAIFEVIYQRTTSIIIMQRTTIQDIAREAGVSAATVDRVLNQRSGVRNATIKRVKETASRLNYHYKVTDHQDSQHKSQYHFAFMVPDGPNTFMRGLEKQIEIARLQSAQIGVNISYIAVPAFSPSALASAILDVNFQTVDGVALVAADGAEVQNAVNLLTDHNVKVVTLVSDLPFSQRNHYAGIDNVAAGRTAATLLGRFCQQESGKLGLLAGSLLLRDHVERKLGFEQVISSRFKQYSILPVAETADDGEIAMQHASDLLDQHPDLVGFYNMGAGNRGLIKALQNSGTVNCCIWWYPYEHAVIAPRHEWFKIAEIFARMMRRKSPQTSPSCCEEYDHTAYDSWLQNATCANCESDIGENNAKRGSSELLHVLPFCHVHWHVQ